MINDEEFFHMEKMISSYCKEDGIEKIYKECISQKLPDFKRINDNVVMTEDLKKSCHVICAKHADVYQKFATCFQIVADECYSNLKQADLSKIIGIEPSAFTKRKNRASRHGLKVEERIRAVLINECASLVTEGAKLCYEFIQHFGYEKKRKGGKKIKTNKGEFSSIVEAYEVLKPSVAIGTVRKRLYEKWPLDQAFEIEPRVRGSFVYE